LAAKKSKTELRTISKEIALLNKKLIVLKERKDVLERTLRNCKE
jgi:hypothetical protein